MKRDDLRRRRTRRRLVVASGVLVAVVAAGVVFDAGGVFGGAGRSRPAGGATGTTVARVMRRSLASQMQVSATLGYAGASTVVVPAGTPPSELAQAQQAVTTARGQVDAARATPAGDSRAGSTREQVAGDRAAVASARALLAGALSSLARASASATAYGDSSAYTWLPPSGRLVGRGGTLYEIDGRPVLLLYGSAAPWRVFAAGMSPGRDVGQLNANLAALGYHAPAGDAFTASTTAAVDAFQAAHGLTATGELALGSVVFKPGRVRVTRVAATLGAAVHPGPVLGVSSTRRRVSIALDAAEQAEVKVGDPVTITLPDNSTTPGRVSHVGTVATTSSQATAGNGGSTPPTIDVGVTPTRPGATGRLDQAPVDVAITTSRVKDALVVPVNALLALAGGRYAVQVETAGADRLVAVRLGLFDDADGLVQVTGDGLAAGRRVVVPSE